MNQLITEALGVLSDYSLSDAGPACRKNFADALKHALKYYFFAYFLP